MSFHYFVQLNLLKVEKVSNDLNISFAFNLDLMCLLLNDDTGVLVMLLENSVRVVTLGSDLRLIDSDPPSFPDRLLQLYL